MDEIAKHWAGKTKEQRSYLYVSRASESSVYSNLFAVQVLLQLTLLLVNSPTVK